MREKIQELGKFWKKSETNPKISEKVLSKWERLIDDWINDETLPIIIRKQTSIRGSETTHDSGRKIVTTDNSFSQWIYCNVLNGNTYSIEEIKDLLKKDNIPMSFAIKASEKEKIKYKKTLGNYSINKRGWKLCHIDPVGLKTKQSLEKIDIQDLENHFKKLANPRNMFLLPLQIGSLGEIQEFIDEQK
jgi:hypothetical protein